MTLTDVGHGIVLTAALVASVSPEGTATIVNLDGEADMFTLPLVVDALTRVIADADGAVIVDLAQLEFIDSATVRALARAWQLLHAGDRRMMLRSPPKPVARVLHLLGLGYLIEQSAAAEPELSKTVAPHVSDSALPHQRVAYKKEEAPWASS